MSAVPMAGTGRGPRPDSTTFTRRATDRTERTEQLTDDATTE
ncbi:hypothetical protein [Halorubrum saccharovorum]|nr:hypothetical protein [Halorubrum saccharovorum]